MNYNVGYHNQLQTNFHEMEVISSNLIFSQSN